MKSFSQSKDRHVGLTLMFVFTYSCLLKSCKADMGPVYTFMYSYRKLVLLIEQYHEMVGSVYSYVSSAHTMYSLLRDRNQTSMGSFLPFIWTGPRGSKWNWGSSLSGCFRNLCANTTKVLHCSFMITTLTGFMLDLRTKNYTKEKRQILVQYWLKAADKCYCSQKYN